MGTACALDHAPGQGTVRPRLRAVSATLDLNADLAEGFGIWSLTDDDALLDVVTSANVACGFHAGDPATMRRVCARAVERGVVIGAQVSYRDLAGFGRRFVDADPAELTADLLYQVGALREFARARRGRGRLPQAARRALQRRRAPRRPGPCRRRGGARRPACRCWACPGRGCSRGRRRRASPRTPRRSATAATPRRGRWCPAPSPARCCPTPTPSSSAPGAWRPTA